MRLLYSGASICDEVTFKRLFLIGNELWFMDRPSVTFAGKWGTIGHASPLRQVNFEGAAVKVHIHAPPSRPAQALYEPYAIADFANPEFARIVREGLTRDPAFARKFIQEQANYGNGLVGRHILDALARADDLTPKPLEEESDTRKIFSIDGVEGLRTTFKTLLSDVSVQVKSALAVADEIGATPVADDPYFLRLLALRTSDKAYVGGAAPHAWWLGLTFAKAVIPDEALQKLSLGDISSYRKKTASVHDAWMADLNCLAAKLDDLSPEQVEKEIPKLIARELTPKLNDYKTEMAAIRDGLFGDLVKGVVDWKVPTLSLASFATLGYATAITAFAGSLAAAVANPIVTYWKARRGARRRHAVSYLVGLSKEGGGS